MTTSELINQLQKADPIGNLQVIVDHNTPIHFVDCLEAYWDGKLNIPIRDPSNRFYNIIGWEITSYGDKVRINTISLDDALLNDTELPVTYNLQDYQIPEYTEMVENMREENRKIIKEVDEKIAKEKNNETLS